MDGADQAGDDRTFRINFTGEGVSRLREGVKEKLKEFMGDYTDDTLVEYVLVLLRNGRSKAEARRELNVFLGDDSISFVSWLWDHLSSNLHLYVQPIESCPDEMAQTLDDQNGTHNLQLDHVSGNVQTDFEYEREKSAKISRSRRNREWKGLEREETDPFPLRSTVTQILKSEEKNHHRPNIVRRSPPRPEVHIKRSREEGRQPTKRDTASHPVIDAPRRLLQFAVRDAVRTVQQSTSRTEPALKRLRSVVSTSTTDSLLDERTQIIRSVARVPGVVSTALKAAAEAAEDVTNGRYSTNVFDRLSHGVATAEPIQQPSNLRESMLEDGEYEDSDQIPVSNRVNYYQRSEFDGEFTGDMSMLERDTGMAADSASDNDGYDNVAIVSHRGLDASQSASSANKDKNSLTLQYSVAQDADEIVRKTRLIEQDPPVSAVANASSKIVNISVNVNTWKPSHYQVPKDVTEVGNRMAVDKGEVTAGKTNVRLPKENNNSMTENENDEMAHADVQKESLKTLPSTPGSYTTSRPFEDVNSRTVFVSNVHFAATKDNLSRHFNKFGEVLKVIIVTDAATGQPKGSAYVEFLRKESAELALSLNGTSFMSRILKVVRRSSVHPEAAPMLGWPRIARASPFASRLGRVPFPRGVLGGAFRARLPVIPGARSLQWKREASTAQATAEGRKGTQNASLIPGNNILSPTSRNLTYIRPESKANVSSGPA